MCLPAILRIAMMPSFRALTTACFLAVTLTLTGNASADDKPLREIIDAEMQKGWRNEKISPAGPSNDATFLRRVYLDLLGTVPTYQETKQFLADPDPNKRAILIDRLLENPCWPTHQANVWDLALFGRNPPGGDATRKRDGFKKWLADQFARNVPYNRWVHELLLAEQEGSELFIVQYRNLPEDATVAVSRIFLGTQLQCARCHDHPYDNWSQRDFYGMTGFFVRLVVVDGGGKKSSRIAEKSTGEVLFTGSVKEQKPGQKGEPVRPKFLGGTELIEPPVPKGFKEPDFIKANKDLQRPLFSRKEKLAAWVTAEDNPYFARAAVNRVWAQFLGRGLVHPVDDLSKRNTPSHPELFETLTRHLIASKFDLKNLIRELVNSTTYQLACTGTNSEALPTWFERARVRPLSAEELLAALVVSTEFPKDGFKGSGDPMVYFLHYFGEPTDGLGNFQGSLSEHLFLDNSSQIRMFAQQRKGNLTETLLTMKAGWEEKVERLFLSVLSRLPSAAERQRFVKHLSSDAKMTPALVEEAVWVLISCSEFRFNH
jgi:hypothetical protein